MSLWLNMKTSPNQSQLSETGTQANVVGFNKTAPWSKPLELSNWPKRCCWIKIVPVSAHFLSKWRWLKREPVCGACPCHHKSWGPSWTCSRAWLCSLLAHSFCCWFSPHSHQHLPLHPSSVKKRWGRGEWGELTGHVSRSCSDFTHCLMNYKGQTKKPRFPQKPL